MAVHVKNSAAAIIAAAVLFAALAVGWLYWRGGGAPLDAEWVRYRDRFMSTEGRIVDEGRGGISTSEGQGFGMLLAAAYNDRIAFDKLWRWTKENLGKRQDGLFIWTWKPDEKPSPGTVNATDGDLLIAWALVRAGQKWNDHALIDEAIRRAKSMRRFDTLAREIEQLRSDMDRVGASERAARGRVAELGELVGNLEKRVKVLEGKAAPEEGAR